MEAIITSWSSYTFCYLLLLETGQSLAHLAQLTLSAATLRFFWPYDDDQ